MTEGQQRAEAARNATNDYMQRKLGAYKQRKAQTDAEYANKQAAKMENDTMNLYKSGLEATDETTKAKYQVASRANLLAEMISNKAKEKGIEVTGNAKDIVNTYLQGFPNDYQKLVDFTHGNQDPEEFAISMGWIEKPQHKGGLVRNIVGAAGDAATGLGQFVGNGAADIIGWTAKQLGADEDRVDFLVNDWKKYLEDSKISKSVDADTNAASYKIAKGVSDLTTTAALGSLGAGALGGTKVGQVTNAVKNSGLLGKAAVGALEGAADMGVYSVVSDGELPSGSDLALGAGLGAAFPLAGAAVKGVAKTVAPRLQLNGLLTPAKLKNVRNRLIDEGTDLAEAGLKKTSAAEAGQWMLDRGIKGTEPEMREQLLTHANKARNMKRTALEGSKTIHTSQSADGQLLAMYDAIRGKPGWEEEMKLIENLINKGGQYRLIDLDDIQHLTDKILKLYNKSGEVSAAVSKEGLAKLRNETKTYIENVAKAEKLGDIKMLNNEIQVSRALEEGIGAKEASNMVSDVLRNTVPGGIIGTVAGPFDNKTVGGKLANFLIGAVGQRASKSAWLKTNLAAKLNKMSGGTVKELERWIGGESKALSSKAEAEILKVLEDDDIARLILVGSVEGLND